MSADYLASLTKRADQAVAPEDLGMRVRGYCLQYKLSLTAFAAMAGVSRPRLSMLVNGHPANITRATIEKLVHALTAEPKWKER